MLSAKLAAYEQMLGDLQTAVGAGRRGDSGHLAAQQAQGLTTFAEVSRKVLELLQQNSELRREIEAIGRQLRSSEAAARAQESSQLRQSGGVLPASTVQSEEHSLEEPQQLRTGEASERERELTQNLLGQIDIYLDMKNRIEEHRSLHPPHSAAIELELLDEIDQLLSQV